jgi:hypothetical protein
MVPRTSPARCGNPLCDRPRPAGKLACLTDWRRLPKDIQTAVWAGYRQGPLSPAHAAAILDAREWWTSHPVGAP